MRIKEKKRKTQWHEILLKKVFLFFIIYLLGIILISWLISKETIPPESLCRVLSAVCFSGAFFSGKTCIESMKYRGITASFIHAGSLAILLIAAGYCFPSRTEWSRENSILTISLLAGSLAAGLLSTKPKKKGKRISRK